MANKKVTRRALTMSIISLILCCAMLVGTTFAWFTDEVTSTGNIIKSGNLDVEMTYLDGTEWKDAAEGAIFDYSYWEPGYTQSRTVKISNVGNLAFKFQLNIIPALTPVEGEANLADVIDVYMFENTPADRADVTGATPVGTLSSLMADADGAAYGILLPTSGSADVKLNDEDKAIAKNGEIDYTIVLKMQESAGNEYQNLSVGGNFSVQLLATQYTYENDSFGNDYDNGADYDKAPVASVKNLGPQTVNATFGGAGGTVESVDLDTSFQFEPTISYEEAQASEYRYWHADFVVKADKDVPADSMTLAGYYSAFCDAYNNGNWVALTSSDDIPAGTEIRLVQAMGNGGISVNYEEICNYGNDGKGFQCGAADPDGSNKGTTITVELRLYETEEPSEANGNSHNVETGTFKVIATFKHTFGGSWTTLSDGTELFYENDGSVTLYDTQNVDAVDYTVPAGVTHLGNYSLSYNNTIQTVTLPTSVKDLGRAFDSNGTIKKVVLNEGLETISSRAFKSTTALEEVVISSTVATIADNAFQKSGIKEIVIPANVKTIGETAFGASMIETVTIEGNTNIEGFAFRGCTKLNTVYLNGDDVNFVASSLNGRNSTWFCNSESNNPNTSNITFYVKNETVAARVKAAMGAEAANTPVYVNGVLYEG